MHKPRDTVGGLLPLLQSASESPAIRSHCSEDMSDLVDPWERTLPWPTIQARSLEVEANVLVLSLGESSFCHFRCQGKETLPGEILSGRPMVMNIFMVLLCPLPAAGVLISRAFETSMVLL